MKSFVENIFIRDAVNDDIEKIRKLVFEVLEEYNLKPAPQTTDKDIEDIKANYFERGGFFEVLVDKENKILGTVGLYPLDDSKVELRKMYFAKEIRGRGLGKKLLKYVVDKSRDKGFRKIILETATVLKEAIGLYKKYGFKEITNDHLSERCDQSYYLDL